MLEIKVVSETINESKDYDVTTIYRLVEYDYHHYLHTIVIRGPRVSTTITKMW